MLGKLAKQEKREETSNPIDMPSPWTKEMQYNHKAECHHNQIYYTTIITYCFSMPGSMANTGSISSYQKKFPMKLSSFTIQ